MKLRLIALGAIALVACSSQQEPAAPFRDLTLEARSEVVPGPSAALRGTVTVTNTTDHAISFQAGGCPVLLQVFGSPDRAGAPAWDQATNTYCTAVLQNVILQPGAAHQFVAQAPVSEVLGATLPNGRYYVGATIRLDSHQQQVPAGDVELTQ